MSDHDAALMRRALELAHLGWGQVQPNPMVGAVIVRDGVIVGEGHHTRYGADHAEVEALRQAGEAARGATMYVTLEPCSHHGKTPPCTDAIVQAGIARVVIAVADPNPAAGGGAARLRDAGVAVQLGIEAEAARRLNAQFFHVHERGAPFVALKLALSLDGMIAARPGERTALTGPAANAEVHRLRAGHDAILAGRGTAAADDPLLTVRGVPVRQPPLRVIVDSRCRLSLDSQLLRTVAVAPVCVLASERADHAAAERLRSAGARVLTVPDGEGGLDLRLGLGMLAESGVRTVLAEGGAAIAASLLRQELVQRIHLFIAPIFLGGGGVPAFSRALEPSPGRWHFQGGRQLGADVHLTLDRVEDP